VPSRDILVGSFSAASEIPRYARTRESNKVLAMLVSQNLVAYFTVASVRFDDSPFRAQCDARERFSSDVGRYLLFE
jgi:hypothetical protein